MSDLGDLRGIGPRTGWDTTCIPTRHLKHIEHVASFYASYILHHYFSPTAEAWGLSQTRHWGTVGQSSGEVP